MAEQMQHYRFTVEEYHRMGEVGIIAADSRVELIGGQIIMMSPIGDLHFKCVNSYNKVLMTLPLQTWQVSVQNPIRLANDAEPQPDIALLPLDYAGGIPTPEHVLLVIEVSDSTLAYDRRVKVPLYAAAGIPEVWITDLKGERVLCFSEPHDEHYQVITQVRRGEQLTSRYLPTLTFAIDRILP
jgi:Uma2 family endonuclease